MKVNTMNSFTLNSDGTFTENKKTNVESKANDLKDRFGDLAIDVVNEILGAIEHEDNVMYYEIKFWSEMRDYLKNDLK